MLPGQIAPHIVKVCPTRSSHPPSISSLLLPLPTLPLPLIALDPPLAPSVQENKRSRRQKEAPWWS